jgi:hypothetical protein
MRGADTVNDEFEVGFNQTFESRWYRAEQIGRVVMLAVVACALFGLLGRGPYSHDSKTSTGGSMEIDYEPIARHSTASMITVHIKHPEGPIRLLVDQHIIEPMGYQHATPRPNFASIARDGDWLTFDPEPGERDVLIRLNLSPTFVGVVPLLLRNGADSVNWSMFVMP